MRERAIPRNEVRCRNKWYKTIWEGVVAQQVAEFHCMLSWGSQTVLGCKENYLSNRILRWTGNQARKPAGWRPLDD